MTALIVQDEFGGDLLRCVNRGESHYFNRLPDGSTVDLTRDQFQVWEPRGIEARTREYVLEFPMTMKRYERLRQRVYGIAQ